MKKLICLGCLCLWACSSNTNQQTPENPPIQKAQMTHESALNVLVKKLQDLEKDEILTSGTLAFSLKSIQENKVLLSLNEQKTLTVASCIKVLTTATALDILGANYKFRTLIEYAGKIEKGILKGDIYIKGGGDPTLGSRLVAGQNLEATLNLWVKKIKALGIRQVDGKIIADEDFFTGDLMPAGWVWGDTGNYFAAPAMAINVLDNTFHLYFQPSDKLGWLAKILRTEPSLSDIEFVNHVKTAEAGTGDKASISGAVYDNMRYVSGTIPQGGTFSIKGAMPDPAMFLAQKLSANLQKSGVQVMEKATTTRLLKLKNTSSAKERTLIYTHLSPDVQKIVNYTNLYSVNLYAEALLKMIGFQIKKQTTTEAGVEALTDYWEKKGLNIKGLQLTDGSGLSANNGITAEQLTEIMYQISQVKYFDDLYNTLPIAGISGTMLGIGNGTFAQNNLRAKSGGMTGVLAYTGYFKTAKGEMMCFTVIANRYTCEYKVIKQKLTELMVEMVKI
jgi:serine-type D-Ala-D-Ala carboxypeptidase/endopeptidase (penicillin-binding protein 4)